MSRPLRVLVVEDSEDDAMLMMRALRRGGYDPEFERVDTAPAMDEALEQRQWDIVLADYAMPHFSGLAALELASDDPPRWTIYKRDNSPLPDNNVQAVAADDEGQI